MAVTKANSEQVHLGMFDGHDKTRERRLRNGVYLAECLLEVFSPKSVVDVGCGVGFLLKAFEDRGSRVTGVDNQWVNNLETAIPLGKYILADLNEPLSLGGHYDLVISLECAEHLRPERGPGFVDDLCNLGDVVMFSAAIPYQGGSGHINARWQEYWANLFFERGYLCYDFVRRKLAGNGDVFPWFRQNTLVFVKDGHPVPPGIEPFKAVPSATNYVIRDYFERQKRRDLQRIRELEKRVAELE